MKWNPPLKSSPEVLRLKDLSPGTAFAWSSTDPKRLMRCKGGYVDLATGGHIRVHCATNAWYAAVVAFPDATIDFGTPKETK